MCTNNYERLLHRNLKQHADKEKTDANLCWSAEFHLSCNNRMFLQVQDGTIVVDAQKYIDSQPVKYSDIEYFIDDIRGHEYNALIDLSCISIYDVNIFSFIRIIWQLYEETYDDHIVSKIKITGTTPYIRKLWYIISPQLPDFVTDMVEIEKGV